MQTAHDLRAKLADPNAVITGVLATYHLWVDLPETLQQAGMDYLIVDLEHGAYSDQLVADVCATGRRINFPVLIRPVSTDYGIVRRVVDMGPCGMMFPCIESAADLDRVREAIYMPPRGKRRPGGPANHWMSSYQYDDFRKVEDALIIWPQIESKVGLQNLDAIANHPLTTAMAIGPYDLSAELGCCWDPSSAKLQAALQSVREAGRRAGKTTWMLGDPVDLTARGFRLLCVGEPIVMLKQAFERAVQAAKGVRPAVTAAAAEHG